VNTDQLKQAGFSDEEIAAHQQGVDRDALVAAGFSVAEINNYSGTENKRPFSKDDIDVLNENIMGEFGIDRSADGAPTNFVEALQAGWQQSVTGLAARQKVPEVSLKEDAPMAARIISQTATLAGDFPWMVGGFALGAAGGSFTGPGAVITGTGGAFALPAGLRKVLIDKYSLGEVNTFSEFWSRLSGAVGETLKGEAVGMATGAAAAYVPAPLTLPAEVSTMVTMGAALEGRVPEPQEFVDAAIVIGGLKGSGRIVTKLHSVYAKTGKRPTEVVKEAEANPAIKEDLLSERAEVSESTAAAFEPNKKFRRETESKGNVDAPVKRSEIVKFLEDNLDTPIRVGRMRQRKNVLGIFKPKEEVVRVRNANDIEVIAHELGHGLQKNLWPESFDPKKGFTGKFLPYKEELAVIATRPKSGQASIPEGFAEFVRLYITNRPEAKTKAPEFYKFFEQTLQEKSPQAKEIFDQASTMYDQWIQQPAKMRVLSQISVGEGKKPRTTFSDIYTATVDDLHPLGRMVKEIGGKDKIPTGKDPYKLARLMRGWHGKAEHFIEHSPYKYRSKENVGKPLKEILKPIKNLDDFRAYIVSMRAIELSKRGIKSGILKKDALEIVAEFKGKYKKAFEELKEYQDHTLQYLADSGVLDAKALGAMREANKDYVPFYRVMEESRGVGTGKGLEGKQPVKKIRGSQRDIVDPLESVIKNTYAYINIAEKNRIGRALVELAYGKDGMGKYVEKIPAPMQKIVVKSEEVGRFLKEHKVDIEPESIEIFRPSAFMPKDNVVSVWKGGKRELYQVHPDIARTFQALDAESVSALMKILSTPAKWLRAGAVLSPEFIARNPIRDQFSAFVYSKYGFIPGWDLLSGMKSLVSKDAAFREWQKGGGAYSMLVSMDRAYLQKRVGDIYKMRIRNYAKNPIEALRVLSELSEAGTRIGEFKKGRKRGATIEDSAFAAREVTLDFSKIGAKTRAVNGLIAFWNANVQGTDKLVRSFKERPGVTSAKVFAGITLPSVLLAIANHDDPRYQDLPQWQKDLFWIIPTEDTIWRIPKPFELGIIFGSVPERMTLAILDKDPEAFDGVMESIGRGAAPGILPTVSIPPIENWANKSFFLDRPIVPASRERLLPEYQYKPYTTEVTKAIGKILGTVPNLKENPNISPAKIENLIRGWSGGLGMHVVRLADYGLRKAGALPDPPRPTKALADIPVVRAFVVRHPSSGAESVQKFYENYNEVQRIVQTAKTLSRKEFKPDEAYELLQKNEAAQAQLDGVFSALRNAHRTVELIYQHPTMDPDEKRQIINTVYLQMSEIAKMGNKYFKEFKSLTQQEN